MRRWTDETDHEAITFFDSLSTAEIRKRQSLCSQQKQSAYALELPDALADLERMETALTAAMLRRCPSVSR